MALLPYSLSRALPVRFGRRTSHELTLDSLARLQNTPLQCLWAQARVDDPVTVAGLRFPNRIGLAAGLDKNGRCIDGLGAMGFGFIEVGTVTPKAQPGNPKPRIFRLPEAEALINRLGFNNEGLDAFLANVQRARFRTQGGVLGLNIGKNASTPIEQAAEDYLRCLDGVYPARRLHHRQHLEPQHRQPAQPAKRRSPRRPARSPAGTARGAGCQAPASSPHSS